MGSILTSKQNITLEYIKSFINNNQYPPTLREIGLGLNIKSTNGVRVHLKALERKGWLKRVQNVSRGIVLSEKVNYG
jgi:repressor LexA